MKLGRADFEALARGYELAHDRIINLPGAERSIGLVALRLRANHFVNQVATWGLCSSPQDLLPLRITAARLAGGETLESGIEAAGGVQRGLAREILSDVAPALFVANYASWMLAAFALVASLFIDFGVWFAGTGVVQRLAGLGVPTVVMVMVMRGPIDAAMREVDRSVDSLGRAADQAMTDVAAKEAEIWLAATSLVWAHVPYTETVRRKGKNLRRMTYILLCGAIILFFYGYISGVVSRPQAPPPSNSALERLLR